LIDKDKIKEVLLNIIDNAVVHSNSRKIDIILENNMSKIILKIIDYGSGINFDYEKLLDKQMKKNRFLAGHGLGLNISKEIMELHGGKLIIDSSVELGTTITLIFPSNGDDR
jgi:signal transduction histidine kinase